MTYKVSSGTLSLYSLTHQSYRLVTEAHGCEQLVRDCYIPISVRLGVEPMTYMNGKYVALATAPSLSYS